MVSFVVGDALCSNPINMHELHVKLVALLFLWAFATKSDRLHTIHKGPSSGIRLVLPAQCARTSLDSSTATVDVARHPSTADSMLASMFQDVTAAWHTRNLPVVP